jgi:hypothetical protein
MSSIDISFLRRNAQLRTVGTNTYNDLETIVMTRRDVRAVAGREPIARFQMLLGRTAYRIFTDAPSNVLQIRSKSHCHRRAMPTPGGFCYQSWSASMTR